MVIRMAALRVFLAVLALGARAQTASISVHSADDVTLSLEPELTGGFSLVLIEDEIRTVYGRIGRTLLPPYTTEKIEGGVEVSFSTATLRVITLFDAVHGAQGIKISWDTKTLNTRFEDCFDFGTKHWYGGPMQENQVYPIENAEHPYSSYVTTAEDNGNIVERFWLNSAGEYFYVHPQVPLFVDYKNLLANHICFGAQIAAPYSSNRNHTELSYDIWFLSDVKAAYLHAVETYLGKPSGLPDYRMVKHPIWSTWAQYSFDINQTNLLSHAEDIRRYGFNDSQFEIDDLWETCYGSLTIDEDKFPDFKQLVQDIKGMGYRVTLWAHPFINKGCEPYYSYALENGYFVLNEEGSSDTQWWDSDINEAGHIDFTNPEAAEWWYDRILYLVQEFDLDSLKFDAGEISHSPQIPVQHGDVDMHPHHIVEAYVRTCARFGNMVEVRVGFRTQDLPIFIRMVDRDSIWGINNGLESIITTTLMMNLVGYPFVLPDMIGGNGYNLNHEQADLPTKELFIRWVEANAFLPSMQFSFAPWNFDDETVEISKRYAELHATYADYIYEAMNASVHEGTPVNAPLWWLDPTDEQALVIWDEFLLGEDILVAPVLTPNTTVRDIYLPVGVWLEEGDPGRAHQGPTWLYNYPAPIHVLPYFVRETEDERSVANIPGAAAILVVFGLLANVLAKF